MPGPRVLSPRGLSHLSSSSSLSLFAQCAAVLAPRSLAQGPPICVQCRRARFATATLTRPLKRRIAIGQPSRSLQQRGLSSGASRREDAAPKTGPGSATTKQAEASAQTPPSTGKPPDPPSHDETSLHPLIQRLSTPLIATLSAIAHQVNTRTGTDYTPISALRDQISTLETSVNEAHATLSDARATHAAAQTTQSAAQTSIVRLLERRDTWSEADIESYTSLVRLGRTHELDTAASRAAVRAAEAELEGRRARLERTERDAYHREQVWSDTIRRNGTWVTFGLMGVNLLILVASAVLLEPWRRRRLVREIRGVVEGPASGGTSAAVTAGGEGVGVGAHGSEKAILVRGDQPALADAHDAQNDTSALAASAIEAHAQPLLAESASETLSTPDNTEISASALLARVRALPAHAQLLAEDLLSSRPAQLCMGDVTVLAAQCVAAGAAGMIGLLWCAGGLSRGWY